MSARLTVCVWLTNAPPPEAQSAGRGKTNSCLRLEATFEKLGSKTRVCACFSGSQEALREFCTGSVWMTGVGESRWLHLEPRLEGRPKACVPYGLSSLVNMPPPHPLHCHPSWGR